MYTFWANILCNFEQFEQFRAHKHILGILFASLPNSSHFSLFLSFSLFLVHLLARSFALVDDFPLPEPVHRNQRIHLIMQFDDFGWLRALQIHTFSLCECVCRFAGVLPTLFRGTELGWCGWFATIHRNETLVIM